MTAKEQNKLVGIFLMAHGGLQALVMILIVLFYGVLGAGMFASAQRPEEQIISAVFAFAIIFVLIFSLIFVVPQLIGGWKIFKESRNARVWGIIASIVACLSFPLGTAAGVFGLVFLFGEQGKQFYLAGENQPHNFPSPPNNWQ